MGAASDTDGRPAYRPSSLDAVLEDVVTPAGPYRLRLMARSGTWRGTLPGNLLAAAHQRPDGRIVVRAPDEEALATARFMLALDDDTAGFHARFARDPLIGPSARALVGYRPLRLATVTHAVVRALCGQLIEARRARAIEQAIARACGETVVTQPALRRLAPVELRRLGLAQQRATVLARLAATLDLERDHPDRPRADASDVREAGGDGVSGEAAEALEVERRREAGEDGCPLLGEAEPA